MRRKASLSVVLVSVSTMRHDFPARLMNRRQAVMHTGDVVGNGNVVCVFRLHSVVDVPPPPPYIKPVLSGRTSGWALGFPTGGRARPTTKAVVLGQRGVRSSTCPNFLPLIALHEDVFSSPPRLPGSTRPSSHRLYSFIFIVNDRGYGYFSPLSRCSCYTRSTLEVHRR